MDTPSQTPVHGPSLYRVRVRMGWVQSVDSYKVDVLCIQETKLRDGIDCNIGKSNRLKALSTDNVHHGVGFIVSSKWKENIHRYWKVSDRIAVLQLTTNAPESKCTQLGQLRLNIVRKVNYS